MPTLRLPDRVGLPPAQSRPALALQGLPEGLLGYERDIVRVPQMPLRAYLLAIAIFCNEVKSKSMLALSRDLGVQYKTSFVLAHKMREAMASEVRTQPICNERRAASCCSPKFYPD